LPTSQNGYSANDINLTTSYLIPGTTRKVRLRKGDTGFLLVHLAAWFDKHIESVDGGEFDDWGYAERPIRGSKTTLSNHASGTAIDLNSARHPLGAVNTFTNAQESAIRKQLKVYEGAIRWGGDYRGRKDEMHFEIEPGTARVARVAAKLRKAAEAPKTTDPRLTIAVAALRLAAEGRPMKVTDSFYVDARVFIAWGRAIGGISPNTESNWVAYHNVAPTGAEQFKYAVRQLQKFLGLPQDGIAGPQTLAFMKPYGYIPIDENGHPL
jgi:hypothetical protein